MALGIIQQGVSKTMYPRIFGMKKAKDSWETLKTEFQGSEKAIPVRLQSLWSQFDSLPMKEGKLVKDLFSKIAEIINQIKSSEDEVKDKKVVEKILGSRPQNFEHIVVVIIETKDLNKLTQYELIGSLEAHEQRVSKYNQPLEQAFQAEGNAPKKSPQQGRGNHHVFLFQKLQPFEVEMSKPQMQKTSNLESTLSSNVKLHVKWKQVV